LCFEPFEPPAERLGIGDRLRMLVRGEAQDGVGDVGVRLLDVFRVSAHVLAAE
jgi:hypothetical protein